MLELSPVFSDGMILPRGREIRVFGNAQGRVTARIADETGEVCAKGAFCVRLPAKEPGGPFTLTVKTDTEKVIVRDVYVGEVYLLAGQSNAQFMLAEDKDFEAVPHTDPLARLFTVPRPEGNTAHADMWVPQTEENAGSWPALAFYTARLLRKERNIPVGVVAAVQGAAVIQSFMSPEGAAKFRFTPEELHPDHTSEKFGSWNPPSYIYERMLAPLYPLSFNGVIWYQGESNTSPAEGARYGEMLRRFIQETRAGFEDAELPFVIVQINDFDAPFSREGWEKVQKAQAETASAMPHAALVKTADLGYHSYIHPVNKMEVSERVAAALLNLTI